MHLPPTKQKDRFLWAAFQVKQVTRCDTIDSVTYALEHLPRGLKAAYDQIYSRIQDRPPPERELAERTIKWVMCAPSLLSSEELLGAVRISLEEDQIKLVNRVQQKSLLSICENLFMVDSEGKWRFFHLSAREYFETTLDQAHPAFSFCAQVCFRSLINTFSSTNISKIDPKSGQSSSDLLFNSARDPFDPKHPFSKHIQFCWPFYANRQVESDESIKYLKQFLGTLEKSSPSFVLWADYVDHWAHFKHFHSTRALMLTSDDIAPITTPMFAIAYFSLYKVLREWFDNQTFDATQKNERSDSLLTISALNNCLPLCTELIRRGANSNYVGFVSENYGNSLAAGTGSIGSRQSEINHRGIFG